MIQRSDVLSAFTAYKIIKNVERKCEKKRKKTQQRFAASKKVESPKRKGKEKIILKTQKDKVSGKPKLNIGKIILSSNGVSTAYVDESIKTGPSKGSNAAVKKNISKVQDEIVQNSQSIVKPNKSKKKESPPKKESVDIKSSQKKKAKTVNSKKLEKKKTIQINNRCLNDGEKTVNSKKLKKKKAVQIISQHLNDGKDTAYVDTVQDSPNKTEDKVNQIIVKCDESKVKKHLGKRKVVNMENSLPKKRVKTSALFTKEKREVSKDQTSAEDSQKQGLETLQWILSPLSVEEFFKDYWEKQTLLVKTESRSKYKGILSCADIDNILRRNNLEFTKNIDLTSYKNGERETHNPEGRALATLVWDFYNSGCSVRMLNPQTFHPPVWKLLATLQDYFGSFCGANVYLTPPGTQGFAPHWDDIEAFILQLEGQKRWRIYKPRTIKETLPRESSKNFGPNDRIGEPVLDCVLEPGDLLYFPRGFIHQGESLDDAHSLHITISTYQKTAWVDLLEKLLPAALTAAAEDDVDFRRGLPIGYLDHLGIVNADKKSEVQKEIAKKVTDLVVKMMKYAPINGAVDLMAKGFIHDSLPPVLTEDELKCSVFEGGEKWSAIEHTVVGRVEILPESSIRLLRRGCVRLMVEENSVRLFYSVENSREYHAEEPKFLEIEPAVAPAVEALIQMYPDYMRIENLPLSALEEKLALAIGLWEKGIITTSVSLKACPTKKGG